MSNSCPHARNWLKITTILDPIAVPTPLSYAEIWVAITMTVHGVEIKTDCNHQYANDNRYYNSDNLHRQWLSCNYNEDIL